CRIGGGILKSTRHPRQAEAQTGNGSFSDSLALRVSKELPQETVGHGNHTFVQEDSKTAKEEFPMQHIRSHAGRSAIAAVVLLATATLGVGIWQGRTVAQEKAAQEQ